MNEYIEVQFTRGGMPLAIRRQLPGGAIELDEPDPMLRRVSIGLSPANEITEYRMRRIRQIRNWAPGEFRLRVTAEGGTLVLRGEDQFALPEGRYRLAITLEEARVKRLTRTVDFDEDGHAECVAELQTDDRTVSVDLSACDAPIRRVLDASTLDGQAAADWLETAVGPRAARKACLLNLLASLRTVPTQADSLLAHVQSVHEALNDRIYARVDSTLLTTLERLAGDVRRPVYREGPPTADIHKRLVESILPAARESFSPGHLLSYRAEGRPSLQIVVAVPQGGEAFAYADIDLDLANPLQDIVGFVVHMGELTDGKSTNHLDLRTKLAGPSARTRPFVYYTVNA